MTEPAGWDAFISHASEDKERFVRPLAEALAGLGARIWYDEFTLKPGMSLSESIDHGLANCRFGLVVLSPDFFGKAWPARELRGLVARQLAGNATILPVWHEVDLDTVLKFSPPLADIYGVRTSEGSAADTAIRILAVIRPDLYEAYPRAELEKRASGAALRELEEELDAAREHLSEFQCPFCRADLVTRMPAPISERDEDEIVGYECGFETFAGEIRSPCPTDKRFPAFTDYELKKMEHEPGRWIVYAIPKTSMARCLHISGGMGTTPEEAIEDLKEHYRRIAPKRLHPD